MSISSQLAASRLIQPGVCTSMTRPASPFEGQCIFETDTDRLLIWNGSSWVIPNQTTTNPEGLEFVGSYTLTTGLTPTVSNIFTSAYTNYRVMLSLTCASTSANYFFARLTSGGTPATSGYVAGTRWYDSNSYGGIINGDTRLDRFTLGPIHNTIRADGFVDFFSPAVAAHTSIVSQTQGLYSGYYYTTSFNGGYHGTASSYDGIQFFDAQTSNVSGTIRVYGYRNS